MTTIRQWALRQHELDADRVGRMPSLLTSRRARLGASSLGFLRGSARLYYELLADRPDLAAGPDGSGWLCGDLHVENFGAFRISTIDEEQTGSQVTFDINDFDDAAEGPWRLDLLRLCTSALLGLADLGHHGRESLVVVRSLLAAYRDGLDGAALPPTPATIGKLLDKVGTRTRQQLLEGRTAMEHGARRFVRGPRYLDLPTELDAAARAAFAIYVAALPAAERNHPEAFTVEDLAWRIAGTGSLGCLRVAVLSRGKGHGGSWIFDLKEQGEPSFAALGPLAHSDAAPAQRVSNALHACLACPPRMVAATSLSTDGNTISMLGRRLAPQEDKLAFAALDPKAVPSLMAYYGALTAAMHLRGAKAQPRRWSDSDLDEILHRAIDLAGLHHAIFLAYCS